MSYYIWIPAITLLYIVQSFLTVKSNVDGGKWTWLMTLASVLPPWVLISKYSKDLVMDAMIFDAVLVVAYSFGLLYFTDSFSKLHLTNWVGIFLMILGIFCFKSGI